MEAPLLPALPGYDNPQLIAHGTTALVFRATQHRLNRLVAIKVITLDTGSVPVNAARELATTVALSSQPHIVSIIDTGTTADDRPYIVMEYCEGGSYGQILRQRGPLPVDDVVEVGVKIGEALHAAHQAGIVHRDVKPSNILRGRFGPALTDFGIARAPDELSTTLTREMMTPHHASPEALLHQAQSGLSDVYSLASTMWTLLIGHPPFVDPSRPPADMYAFRDRVLHDPLPAMTREDVPGWLIAELARAMEKLPSNRHAHALEFAESVRRGSLGLSPVTGSPSATARGRVHVSGLPAQAWPIADPSASPSPAPADVDAAAVPTAAATDDPAGSSRGDVSGAAPASSPAASAAPAPTFGAFSPVPPSASTDAVAAATSPSLGASPAHTADTADPVGPPAARTPWDDAPAAGSASSGVYVPPPREAAAASGSAPVSGPTPGFAPTFAAGRSSFAGSDDLDQGGWLGPLAPAHPGADVETTRHPRGPEGSTRRFTEQDLQPGAGRRNGVMVALIGLAVLGVAIGAALVLATGGGPRPLTGQTQPASVTPSRSPSGEPGAPTDVRVARDGRTVTVTWSDPAGGRTPFLVAGTGPNRESLKAANVERGETTAIFVDLDPAKRYCFVVAAVYTIERVARAPSTCTP